MRLPSLPSAGLQQRRAARDQLREQRLEAVLALVDRLLYDLGRMAAGHTVDLEAYVAPQLTAAIRASLRPFLESGDVMRPDFGPYGELRVEGDLMDLHTPVEASVAFEDRSTREYSGGRLDASPRRRIRMRMRISLQQNSVVDLTCIVGAAAVA